MAAMVETYEDAGRPPGGRAPAPPATPPAVGPPPVPPEGEPGRRPTPMAALCDQAAADLAAWADGEREALDRLVRRVTPVLWHVVRAYRLDQATTEDVLQTTWLSLIKNRARISDPQAIVRWLTVTARREAWRQARQDHRTEPAEGVELELRTEAADGPESVIVRSHRDAALWEAVGRLSHRCQRLLRVVAFSDRPDYTGLSTELGMPVGSIGPTRGRCLAKLRALLGSARDWSS